MSNEAGKSSTPSEKYVKWLYDEAKEWEQEGIITEEQYTRITTRYQCPNDNDDKSSKFIAIIAILGSILLGLGAILFFASNWKYFGIPVKLGLIFGLITVTYAVGYWLAYEKKMYIGVGKALILLGVLFFGAGIWLVAQIFNINAHYPDGILYWALGALLVSLATRLKPVICTTAVLLTVWTIMEQADFLHANYLYLAVMLVLVIPLIYLEKSIFALILATISLSIWFIGTSMVWNFGEVVLYLLGVMLIFYIFLYNFSKLQKLLLNYEIFEMPYKIMSLLGILSTLYFFTFRGIEELSISDFQRIDFTVESVIVCVILLLICFTSIYLVIRFNAGEKNVLIEGIVLASISLLILINCIILFIGNGWLDKTPLSIIFTIIYNVIFIGLIVCVLAMGFKDKRSVYVNIALVFFSIDVVTRYFDYFWSLLPRSIFFIIGGLILLIGGIFLERRRRKMLEDMR